MALYLWRNSAWFPFIMAPVFTIIVPVVIPIFVLGRLVFVNGTQSALFNLVDLITVILLFICICTYIRSYRKGIFDVQDGSHHGLRGVCWKASRIGERLSPYMSVALLLMAAHVLFFAD